LEIPNLRSLIRKLIRHTVKEPEGSRPATSGLNDELLKRKTCFTCPHQRQRKQDANMADVLIQFAWIVQGKYVSLVLVKHQVTEELPNLIHNIPVNW
jgi:hypothetical protein